MRELQRLRNEGGGSERARERERGHLARLQSVNESDLVDGGRSKQILKRDERKKGRGDERAHVTYGKESGYSIWRCGQCQR